MSTRSDRHERVALWGGASWPRTGAWVYLGRLRCMGSMGGALATGRALRAAEAS